MLESCPAAYEKTLGTAVSSEDKIQMINWIDSWSALSDKDIRNAALDPENKLRKFLTKITLNYLGDATAAEVSRACSKIAVIKNNQLPELSSDILLGTKNYSLWLDSRAEDIMDSRYIRHTSAEKAAFEPK